MVLHGSLGHGAQLRIFVAGASGAIGRRLCLLLVADGCTVVGATRSPEKAGVLRAMGVEPVVVDVFDAQLLREALAAARPEVVIHQLTDLPAGLPPERMAEGRIRNAHLRKVGTRNLVAATIASGAKRMIAQSVAFAYAPGTIPYDEDAPLNTEAAPEAGGASAQAIASLEQQVLEGPFAGVVLRYGKLYGPGTGFEQAPAGGPVHVDAAADAARRALARGAGIYNIAEDDGTVLIRKAIAELGWSPGFRIIGTRPG